VATAPQRTSAAALSLAQALWPWGQRSLISQMARRDVSARYRQSWLGTAWLVLTPLLMLTVYTLVFQHVMNVRWPGAASTAAPTGLAFALQVYAGLAAYNLVAECVARAPTLVLEQPHLVKKVVFPLPVLAWVQALTAGVGLAVSALLLLGMTAWVRGGLPLSALALPVVWLPLWVLCLGLVWWLSAVGTYVRDVAQVLGPALGALMFLSPIFYPLQALPATLQTVLGLNPLATVIEQTRIALIVGQWPDWGALGLLALVALGVAAGGAAFFRLAQQGFADVL
jgi:lipopolysaccharide transport system permease protein